MHTPRPTLKRLKRALLALSLPALGLSALAQAPDLKTGLKAYWDFEGDLNDKSTSGIYDGTENGSTPIAYVNGKAGFGKAVKMDGEDQFIEITGGEPDDLAFEGGSMSVAGWFKVDAFDTQWQALIAKGEGSNWRIHRRGGESGFAHAGGTGEGPAGGAVDDGGWHHFVAISDVDAANFGTALYIDGVKYTENASAPNLAANGKRVMIGENPDARSREWEGELDDIAIWDRVITEAEIAQLYANGVGKPLSVVLGAKLPDADNDGMPDDYETEMGFNPSDPSDAAKDFDGDGVSNLDEFKAGTNPIDVTKPTIVASAGSPSFNTITLTFSEDLDPATATVVGNYTITPALAISAASYSKKAVTLTTAAQTPGATAYAVAVKGIKDTSKNEIAAGTSVTVYSYLLTKTGVAKISVYENISGGIDALYGDPKYPASPDRVGSLYSFNSRDFLPTDALENYGAVMEALITPTQSGDYRFFIYSDDASQLFLSTDDKEANLVQIAEEPGCCNFFAEPDGNHTRTSEPTALVAGRKYLLRLVYKEGGGGDYGQVAWRREGDTTPAGALTPIPGRFLSSVTDLPAPPEGIFLTRTPGANATRVSPGAGIRIVHADGKSEWTAANVSLKVNGAAVAATITKDGNQATIVYQPPALFPSGSVHTVSLTHPDPAGNPTTTEWSFTAATYKGPVLDNVKGYAGLILGSADFTADKGGRSGSAGDLAIDLTTKGGPVQVIDNAFLAAVNAATAADELSVSMWIKKYDIADSSAVWFSSPTQGRVFQAHTPWSNNNIYFDTAGCCDASTQRINADVAGFPDYTGDVTWWQSWRHYVFTKKAGAKQIWIDGKLFLEGENTGPLSTDINQLMIGSDNAGGGLMHGLVDDFAVFSKALTEANVNAIKGGTKPNELAAAGPIAFWDFNTKPAEPSTGPTFGISRNGNKVTITSVAPLGAGFVLQTAPTVNGPWTTQAGATTPITVDIGAANAFLRAVKP